MYKILKREDLSPSVHLLRIDAPQVAAKARAGQFVTIMSHEKGERIPLTLADWDSKAGTVDIVFLEAGKTTKQMAQFHEGDSLFAFLGPLGVASHVEQFGSVVCIGGGVGIAAIAPIAKALKEAGNTVNSIIGARNKDLLFWEEKMRSASTSLVVTTDDGSRGRKGVVTEPLKELLEKGNINRVIAVGPAIMMKFCALTTLPYKVKTMVSLNSVMVDGTGLCGSCRVSVGGETKFACFHGPDFDGHQVDWNLLQSRQSFFKEEEQISLALWAKDKAPAVKS